MSNESFEPSNIYSTTATLLSDIGGVSPSDISGEARIREDLGISSLNYIEIVIRLEDTFNIQIEEEDAARFQTVSDITDFISSKVN